MRVVALDVRQAVKGGELESIGTPSLGAVHVIAKGFMKKEKKKKKWKSAQPERSKKEKEKKKKKLTKNHLKDFP